MPAALPRQLPRQVLIPLIVACALFMEQVDSTIISTALPAIATSLQEDPVSLKLAMTSYLLSLAVFIPASGWAADRYGARTVFRSAIVIFTLGSILCGLSTGLVDFVLYRIIQGMGGAMMVPVGRLVILRSIPKAELVSALAWLTMPALLGPVLGPPLGGFITTYFDWRLIFFINVPIGILGVILATRFIENVREEDVPPLDLRGLVLSGLGLSGIVAGLALMGEAMMSVWLAVAIGSAGIVIFAFYVRHAHRTPNAVIDLTLLRLTTFRAGVLGASLFRVGIGAIPFLLPLMLQLTFGLSPLASGLLTFASSAGALVMKTTAAPIIRHFGFRRILVVNSLLSSAFIAANVLFTPDTPHLVIMAVLLVGGFFRSLEFTALNAIAYADVEQADMSRATSFASVAQQVSLSVGVAVAGMVLETMREIRGSDTLVQADFTPAFLVVAAISALSVFSFLRLPKDAGAEMAGAKSPIEKHTLPDPRSEVPPQP